MLEEMKNFLATSEDFRNYVARDMDTYDRTLTQELQSPITQEYYRSLQKGGCNHKEV